jgi:hypothetical protein
LQSQWTAGRLLGEHGQSDSSPKLGGCMLGVAEGGPLGFLPISLLSSCFFVFHFLKKYLFLINIY